MRGLKQIFGSLYLYHNNVFIDGKKVEYSHQWGKLMQLFRNNSKGYEKEWVTKNCLRWFALLFIVNGGRWGPDLQQQLGHRAINLKHPWKHNEPHPLMSRFAVSRAPQQTNVIEVTQMFAKKCFNQQWWNKIIHDQTQSQLMQLLREKYNQQDLSMVTIQRSKQWKISRIKSFKFHNHNKSFALTFHNDNTSKKNQPKCIAKTRQGYIMRFDVALVIEYLNHDPAWVCKAEYWPVHKSTKPNNWLDDYFNSMDFVNNREKSIGWCHLTNILEPVYLIHNCVNFASVEKEFAHMSTKINKFDYVQNMHYWSQRLKKYSRNNNAQAQLQLPCGPHWICKQHKTTACQRCETNNFIYPQQLWLSKWVCNVNKDPYFWIFDSKNGLVMTMMRQIHKEDDNTR